MGKSIGVMTPGCAAQTNGMALTAAMAVLMSRYLAVLHEVSTPCFAEWDT